MSQRDPFTDPFYRTQDLGLAIPDDDHAVSVCLPTWDSVVGYEEGREEVIDALECGYPRFVEHPMVAELFYAAQEEFARKNEVTLVFPSLAAAWRCADFAKTQGAAAVRLESYGWNQLTVLLVQQQDYDKAWKGWQHIGEIVSSRLAQAALTDAPIPEDIQTTGDQASQTIRERIAQYHKGTSAEDVYLFSSGMAAIAAAHRLTTRQIPDCPTIQLEFPYLDAYKVQEKCNPSGVINFCNTTHGGLDQVRDYFTAGKQAAALFTEVPSNPLLRTADLRGIATVLRDNQVPLVIDDTIATSINVDTIQYADVVTTSLTKAFSGDGDVAAGALILNPQSPSYAIFKQEIEAEVEASPLFALDAIALEVNSRHFEERVLAMNANADAVVDYLIDHPRIAQLWHPSVTQTSYYDQIRRDDGGHGALLSIQLKGGQPEAAKFYDRLRISKGPSLGTNFSLACPYTLLAHYDELDWADQHGVPSDLIRLWIGLEEPDDLVERLEEALS